MAQLFPVYANTLVRVALAGIVLAGFVVVGCAYALYFSPFNTNVGVPVAQPVPFSHQHHVGGLGIDCRYCHTGVERSSFAGIPSTQTCMTCHSQVWRDAAVLQPVRESWTTQKPLHWTRVNDLPDYVYFDHSVHVAAGVGCVSCHGRVDQMPLLAKGETLFMRWCLDCHRNPAPHLRPPDAVFSMALSPVGTPEERADLLRAHRVPVPRLEDCSTCHR